MKLIPMVTLSENFVTITNTRTAKILIVHKKSQYELYRDSTDAAVRAYLEGDKVIAKKLLESHKNNYEALIATQTAFLRAGYKPTTVYRGDVTVQQLHDADLIVGVGGDGTILDIAHLCGSTPVLGVNSDPKNSFGFLCAANASTIDEIVNNLATLPLHNLATLQPYIDGNPTRERAINDLLFAHSNVAAMTKYDLLVPIVESRKDSGLLVCTATGSTAWMYNAGGESMQRGDHRMQYRSRDLRHAKSLYATELEFISKIREGILVIDTQHIRYDVSIGQKVKLAAGEPFNLIGEFGAKRESLNPPN